MSKRPRASSPQRQDSKKPKEVLPSSSVILPSNLDKEAQKAVIKATFNGNSPQLRNLLTEPGWKQVLEKEMNKPYFKNLEQFLANEWSDLSQVIYPPAKDIFNAFNTTEYKNIRVVLIGQDPYHGPRQATGLSFSVPKTERLPSSLKNIFAEIKADLGYYPGSHGDLSHWAEQVISKEYSFRSKTAFEQGVLMLNSVLTVRKCQANSHRNKGWELFTDAVIDDLNQNKKNLVFILWGKQAQTKGMKIDESTHCVLKAAHPSGLSAHKGFFGSKPFSKCNDYLQSKGTSTIDWRVE